jgi:hypothetical protein
MKNYTHLARPHHFTAFHIQFSHYGIVQCRSGKDCTRFEEICRFLPQGRNDENSKFIRDAKNLRFLKGRVQQEDAFFTRKLGLNLWKKLVKCNIWSIALYGAETWTLRNVDQKYLERFEMWCWGRMEKISWIERVRNEVLHRVKGDRNILNTIKRRKSNWIGHILRRSCLLKHVIEGKLEGRIEMMGRRGRRHKQLLDDVKENRRYWKLKERALDRTMWRTRFGRGYGPVLRQRRE